MVFKLAFLFKIKLKEEEKRTTWKSIALLLLKASRIACVTLFLCEILLIFLKGVSNSAGDCNVIVTQYCAKLKCYCCIFANSY